jgi:hypothetical protein
MTMFQTNEKTRVTRMLRKLRPGSRVQATNRSATPAGTLGVVVETEPFASDGIRRIRVRWDGDDRDRLVLPQSIEEAVR